MKQKSSSKSVIDSVFNYKIVIFVSCLVVFEKLIFSLCISGSDISYKSILDAALTLMVIIPFIYFITRDRNKASREQERAMYLALHDSLTGLPNRTSLKEELKKAIKINEKKNTNIAVMFLDLDKFKIINDNLGHEIGDKLLQAASQRFQNCIREKDIICRLGGDEFVMAFTDIKDRQAVEIIAQKVLDILKAPFSIENYMLNITASIGISLCPMDSKEADELIKYADMAMYRSKLYGKNRFEFYTDDLYSQKIEIASDIITVVR